MSPFRGEVKLRLVFSRVLERKKGPPGRCDSKRESGGPGQTLIISKVLAQEREKKTVFADAEGPHP